MYADEKRAPIPLTTHDGAEFFEINVTKPVQSPALHLSAFGIYNGNDELELSPYINLTGKTLSIKGHLFAAREKFFRNDRILLGRCRIGRPHRGGKIHVGYDEPRL